MDLAINVILVVVMIIIYDYFWHGRHGHQPQAPVVDNTPAEVPITAPRNGNLYYSCIRIPYFNQLVEAAFLWNRMACEKNLQYIFVGSFVARLLSNGDDFVVHELEVLIDQTMLTNNLRRLRALMDGVNNLIFSPSNERYIVIRENDDRGFCVLVRFFGTGTKDYPEQFIHPQNMNFHSAQHVGDAATYRGIKLPYLAPNDVNVPVLRFDLLLRQRLLRFNPNSRDPAIKDQKERDSVDIRIFLRCAVLYDEPPFPAETVNILSPIVKKWINHMQYLYQPSSLQELGLWRSLRLLTDADVVALANNHT